MTEQSNTANPLNLQENCIKSIIQSSEEAIVIINTDAKVIVVNDFALQQWDYSMEEIKGLDASLLIENTQFLDWLNDIRLNKGKESSKKLIIRNHEIKIRSRFNYNNPGLANCIPLLDDKNLVIGGVIKVKDQTEANFLEKAFWENEEKLKYITTFAHDAILMIDPKGKIIFWNKTASSIFGYSDEEVYGVDLHSILAPERYHDAIRKGFSGFLETGSGFAINKTLELTALRKSGEEFPIELSLSAIMINKKWNAIGIIRDISERKIAEQKIIESEAYFRTLIDISPDAIITTDSEGKINFGSIKSTTMFGFSRNEEFIDTSIFQWVDPAEKDKVLKRFSGIIEGNNIPELNEYNLIKSDGSSFLGEISSAPIHNSEGNISGLLLVIHDITKRKKAENELIQAKNKAEEGDRLKTAFIQNLSHEIRTPMNALVGFSELMKDPDQSDDDKKIYINSIIDGTNQLLYIITDLVEISNIKANLVKINMVETDPENIMINVFAKYSPIASEKNLAFNIESNVEDLNKKVLADDIIITKILDQLIRNAIKFTSCGNITVGYRKSGDALKFFIKDTGIGIPGEYHSRIFDSFYQVENTISRRYEGTGLGLTISKSYVELLGGTISLISEPGSGSEFIFSIPFLKDEQSSSIITPVLIDKKSIVILVAEDDDNNFFLINAYLSDTKFKIIRASNGLEALNICKTDKKIDLILMDIRMPVMDGFTASEKIKQIRPGIAIVAQTAYADEKQKVIECGCMGYISKPFDKLQLLETVRKILTKVSG